MNNQVIRCYDGENCVEIIELSRVPCIGEEIIVSDHEGIVAHYRVLTVVHESGLRREGTYLSARCDVTVLLRRGIIEAQE